MRKTKQPLSRSITIGCVIFIFLLCISLCFANLTLYEDYVYDDYQDYISEILNYTLSQIDGDDLQKCIETGEESPRYKETLLFMDNLMEHYDDIHYLYAILPLNTEDTGNTMSVLSAERYYDRYVNTDGNLYLGWISDDEFDAATAAQFTNILHGNEIVYFEERTGWGVDYTGAMPILDSAGNPVAVLAVDIDISFITMMVFRYAAINICVVLSLGVMFTLIFLFWSRHHITQPIEQLKQSAVDFADRSHQQRNVEELTFNAPKISQDNEVKALSDAVVKMTDDIRDYVTDIIDVEKKAENLKELANRDSLTGIRNKTAYDHDIDRIEARLQAGYQDVGLAIVDLNYLKKTNDTYGHDKGNASLVQLCNMICHVFDHSPVYRIGGDEFVIILKGQDLEDYEGLARRFEEELARRRQDPSLPEWEKISAAIGAAFFDPSLDDGMKSVFKRADAVMYENKKRMKAARSD